MRLPSKGISDGKSAGSISASIAFAAASQVARSGQLIQLNTGTSFSSAFVPVLSEMKEKGDDEALQDLLNHVAGEIGHRERVRPRQRGEPRRQIVGQFVDVLSLSRADRNKCGVRANRFLIR